MDSRDLFRLIKECFNLEGLKQVAFELGLHQNEIPFSTIDETIRNLISFCKRRGLLTKLIDILREHCPHIRWTSFQDPSISGTFPPKLPPFFVGRQNLLSDLATRLKGGEKIALHGMGGVGKTTLATKLVEELEDFFTGGIFWGMLDIEESTRKILEAWGHECDPFLTERLPLDSLASKVRHLLMEKQELGPQLFVIDTTSKTNDIHKLLKAARYIEKALPPQHSLLILVRDRQLTQPFQVSEVFIPPLSPEESLEMFEKYAGIEAQEKLEAEPETVRALLDYLGYLPLAIELAARLLRSSRGVERQFGVTPLFNRIKANLHVNDEDDIKSKLWAVLKSSYNNLSDDTKRVFRWLGVFSPDESIRLDSIEGVLNLKDFELDKHLLELVRHALLKLDNTPDEYSSTTSKYHLHQLLNLFALEKITDANEESEAKNAHLNYYLTFVMQNAERKGSKHNELESKLTNILLAIEYAQQLEAYESVRAFGLLLCTRSHFLNVRGYSDIAKSLLSSAEQACLRIKDHHSRAILLGSLGLAYDYDGDVERAIELIEEALSLARKSGDRRGEGIWLERLGEIHQFQGQLSSSLRFYEQALMCHRSNEEKRHEAIVTGCIGRIHSDRGEYHIAIQKFKQAQEMLAQSDNKIEDGRWLDMLGLAHRLTGNTDEAIAYFNEAIEVYSNTGNIRAIGESYGELGLVYYTLGNMIQADKYFELAHKFSRDTNNKRGEAKALTNKGLTFRFRGELERSIGYFNQAISICDDIRDLRNKANALAALGITYRYLGQNKEAIKIHEQALLLRRQIEDKRGEGASIGNIGNSYLNMGEYEIAIEKLTIALDISRNINDQRSIGNALDNLGRAYHHQGYANEALNYLEESLEISRNIKQRRSEANRLGRIGNAYRKLGEPDKAVRYLKEAVEISQDVGDKRSQGNHLGYLGKAYIATQNLREAENCLRKAVALCREINDKRKEGIWYGELGIIYKSWGEGKRAKHHLTSALGISQRVNNKHNEAISLSRLGVLDREEYKISKAITKYKLALDHQRKVGDKLEIATDLNRLGNAYRDRGEMVEAEKHFREALDIFTELNSTPNRVKVLANLGSLLLSLDKVEEAKNRLLDGVKLLPLVSSVSVKAYLLSQLGIAHSRANSSDAGIAVNCGRESLEQIRAIDNKRLLGKHYSYLGEIYLHTHNLQLAKDCLKRSLKIARDIDNLGDIEWSLARLGSACEAQGDEKSLIKATEYYRESLQLCKKLGDAFYEARRNTDLSRVHLQLSNFYKSAGTA